MRIGELCEIRIGHLRLHDPDGARLQIPDANGQLSRQRAAKIVGEAAAFASERMAARGLATTRWGDRDERAT